MRCRCGCRLKTTHSYQAGTLASTRRLSCAECKRVYTVVAVVVAEEPGQGEGAYALARGIESGEVKVGVSRPEPGEAADPLADPAEAEPSMSATGRS